MNPSKKKKKYKYLFTIPVQVIRLSSDNSSEIELPDTNISFIIESETCDAARKKLQKRIRSFKL